MALLVPSRVKFRKAFRGKRGGVATRGNEISFGAFALKSEDSAWISARQIEAARRAMTRFTQRGGRIWIRIFPHRPITQKGSQATMGGGKGIPEYYVAAVHPGTIIFEMDGVSEAEARKAMTLAGYKLSVKTKFIVKD